MDFPVANNVNVLVNLILLVSSPSQKTLIRYLLSYNNVKLLILHTFNIIVRYTNYFVYENSNLTES